VSKKIYFFKVVKSYGKEGEVFVRILEDPLIIKDYSLLRFIYKGEERTLTLENIKRRGGKSYIVKFKEINSKEKAEALRGIVFYIEFDDLKQEHKEKFYEIFLEGFSVVDKELGLIGKVNFVEKGFFYDILHIEKKGEEILLPFVEKYIEEIDEEKEQIIVSAKDIIEIQE
jgi:16S rRNA processing protein RimM